MSNKMKSDTKSFFFLLYVVLIYYICRQTTTDILTTFEKREFIVIYNAAYAVSMFSQDWKLCSVYWYKIESDLRREEWINKQKKSHRQKRVSIFQFFLNNLNPVKYWHTVYKGPERITFHFLDILLT